MARLISDNPERALRQLRRTGRASLPSDPVNARLTAQSMTGQVDRGSLSADVADFIGHTKRGRESLQKSRGDLSNMMSGVSPRAMSAANDMHRRRTAASTGSGSVSDATLALPKLRDPFRQWEEKFWFFEDKDFNESLKRVRKWAGLLYMTHPLVPSMIDIYARFPLLDIEFKHEDRKLADFYETLFMQELDYESFLYNLSREYWVRGEAFALGSWHDGIGAWDADELINPDDVIVSHNKVLRQYEFHIKVPESIKKLIETRQPREEYQMLVEFFPYVIDWAQSNKEIPVSDVLMKHMKFEVNPWNEHGVPILMRAFRTLMLEESLLAAQDAVADRLYSPLILARLGIDDVDEEGPWIPEPEEIDSLRDDLALALMSDFRLICYHHGLQIESVFGREVMPRFGEDFDRVDAKLMQVFGIGAEMLQGGSSGVPYASGALNKDLMTQMLSTHQNHIRKFLRERMEVVAERQGHYEFRTVGNARVPITERVLMMNEETGEEYIEERPKLAIPEVQFKTMDLNDETVEREFLLAMRTQGIPISDEALMANIPWEFEEELERVAKDKMDKTIAELEFQKELFERIFYGQLPVPPEYLMQYQAWLASVQAAAGMMPATDISSPAAAPNVAPSVAPMAPGMMMGPGMMMQPGAPGAGGGGGGGQAGGGEQQRPKESDSARGKMPKQAKISQKQLDSAVEAMRIRMEENIKNLKEGNKKEEPQEESILDKPVEQIDPYKTGSRKTFGSPEHMVWRRKMNVAGLKVQEIDDEPLPPTQPRIAALGDFAASLEEHASTNGEKHDSLDNE